MLGNYQEGMFTLCVYLPVIWKLFAGIKETVVLIYSVIWMQIIFLLFKKTNTNNSKYFHLYFLGIKMMYLLFLLVSLCDTDGIYFLNY